jgi:predicted RecB family nuclease
MDKIAPLPHGTIPITGSMLYSLVSCPHRVTMDLFADPADRDQVSPFVQLLWDRGAAHEQDIMAGTTSPYLDLSAYAGAEKEGRTLAAMEQGEPLIYGGRISAGDLVGIPDLLRKEMNGYVPGDIKSGAGEEGGGEENNGKPKESYAVQLALYVDILEQLGYSAGRRGFIWDVHREEVAYDLVTPIGARNPRTLWNKYQERLAQARAIVAGLAQTLPAYSSGDCKNCVWYTKCLKTLEDRNDLTLISGLGRAKRDVMIDRIGSVREFAEVNPTAFFSGTDRTVLRAERRLSAEQRRLYQPKTERTLVPRWAVGHMRLVDKWGDGASDWHGARRFGRYHDSHGDGRSISR